MNPGGSRICCTIGARAPLYLPPPDAPACKLLDFLPVLGYVSAAWIFPALPALQIVGGIDDPAPRAGVVTSFLHEPLFIADSPDPFQIFPELDPMGLCRLELFQLPTGVLLAFPAEVNPPLGSTGTHLTVRAVGQSLFRAASVASALFFRVLRFRRQNLQPGRVFSGGDEPPARLAVEPAYSGKSFLPFSRAVFFLLHDSPDETVTYILVRSELP